MRVTVVRATVVALTVMWREWCQVRCRSRTGVGGSNYRGLPGMMLVRDTGIEPDIAFGYEPGARGLKCTLHIRGQRRTKTFHHPEKLLAENGDDP